MPKGKDKPKEDKEPKLSEADFADYGDFMRAKAELKAKKAKKG